MNNNKTFYKLTSKLSISFKLSFTYLIFGVLWILLSDHFLSLFVKSASILNGLSIFKELFFIIATSIFLYVFSTHKHKDIQETKKKSRETERQISAIFEAASTISFIITSLKNSKSIITEFSHGAEQIFGYKSTEVIGKDIELLFNTDNIRKYDDLTARLSEHHSVSYEVDMLRKSGEIFPATVTIYPLFDENDKLTGALGVTFDFTEFRMTENKLKETTEFLRAILDSIPDNIGVQDLDHNILEYNQAGCQFFNMQFKDIIGQKCYKLLGRDSQCELCATAETLRTGKPAKVERYQDEMGIWIDVRAYPVLNEDGQIVKVIEHMRDITERKKAEELLKTNSEVNKKLLDEVVEYDRIKTEFFSNISHELRTPLTVIYSALQLMDKYKRDGKLSVETENVGKYITTMKQNSFRLLRLINNLIDLTRIDSGFYKMKLENHNIVNIVEEITLSVADYIENKSIKLQFDTSTEEKIMAVDADKIERIILNILSNAAKFTKPGGEIWVNVLDKEDSVIITVKDTGIGIPEDKIPIIFERFRQVDSSLTRSHEGSGIGLSLVRSFVEMHGGKIDVESDVGEGTQFIIELPVVTLPDNENGMVFPKTKNNYVDMINIEFSDIYFGNIA